MDFQYIYFISCSIIEQANLWCIDQNHVYLFTPKFCSVPAVATYSKWFSDANLASYVVEVMIFGKMISIMLLHQDTNWESF